MGDIRCARSEVLEVPELRADHDRERERDDAEREQAEAETGQEDRETGEDSAIDTESSEDPLAADLLLSGTCHTWWRV